MAATELEHFLFRTSYRDAARAGHHELEPAGWYLEDYQLQQGARTEDFHAAVRRHLDASGVPVESSKGEWGRGQHEVNVRYADGLETADRHTVFKQCLKETADRHGVSVTFMAKPHTERAGSSCHVHLSLWRDGQNAFAGDLDLGVGPARGSQELRWFLGGCLRWVPELVVLLAPTVNSYKRFVDGSWAPTRVAWSYDNRTAGFRLVGDDQSLRIECRIPGADCNPYLALVGARGRPARRASSTRSSHRRRSSAMPTAPSRWTRSRAPSARPRTPSRPASWPSALWARTSSSTTRRSSGRSRPPSTPP